MVPQGDHRQVAVHRRPLRRHGDQRRENAFPGERENLLVTSRRCLRCRLLGVSDADFDQWLRAFRGVRAGHRPGCGYVARLGPSDLLALGPRAGPWAGGRFT